MSARQHNEVNLDWLTVLVGPLVLLLLLALGVEGMPSSKVQKLSTATVTADAAGNAPSRAPRHANAATD